MRRGVYRIAGSRATFEQEVMAAVLAAGPGAVASHATAARLHGLPAAGTGVEVSVKADRKFRAGDGIALHRASRLDRADCVSGGLHLNYGHVRTPLHPRMAALLVGYIASGYAPSSRLALGAQGRSRRGRTFGGDHQRGIPVTTVDLTPIDLVGGPAAQHLEVAGCGLPVPIREHEVVLPDGRVKRLDFYFEGARVAVEIDSYRHHSSLTDWSDDHVRDNELQAAGIMVLRFTYLDLERDPDWVAGVVRDTLLSRGGR